MNWYLKVLKQYADFNGRARRTEYWMYTLFTLLFAIVAMVLDNMLGLADNTTHYGPIYLVYGLATFLPSLGVTIRRLHDTGKSGWMIFVSLIPIVGSIWLLVLLVTEGDSGENEYGPDPKTDFEESSDLLDN